MKPVRCLPVRRLTLRQGQPEEEASYATMVLQTAQQIVVSTAMHTAEQTAVACAHVQAFCRHFTHSSFLLVNAPHLDWLTHAHTNYNTAGLLCTKLVKHMQP